MRSRKLAVIAGVFARSGSALALAAILAGCSTDVSRFDFPVLSMNDSGSAPGSPSVPALSRPRPSSSYSLGGSDGAAPIARDGSTLKVANLPDVASSDLPAATAQPGATTLPAPAPLSAPAQAVRPARAPVHTSAAPPDNASPSSSVPAATTSTSTTSQTGTTIDVAPGDTLFKLAHRHNVSYTALMAANNLQSLVIKPGQKLIIPAAAVVSENRVPKRTEKAREQAVATMAPTIAGGGAVYAVQAGDSLYAIAKRLHVKPQELASLNGITDPAKVRQGQVLKIPGAAGLTSGSGTTTAAMQPSASVANAGTDPAAGSANIPTASAKPGLKTTQGRVASLSKDVPAAATPAKTPDQPGSEAVTRPAAVVDPATGTGAADTTGVGFRWPVKGKVIGNFGPKTDGSHNDGINIAVPSGTDVLATQDGTVAYSGNELKGYGNLILIRHDDNWVSAYAHNDTMMVKRGDKIKRGQIIAKAGKSGSVDQPQVHFELRQGSKPVDPLLHLAAN